MYILNHITRTKRNILTQYCEDVSIRQEVSEIYFTYYRWLMQARQKGVFRTRNKALEGYWAWQIADIVLMHLSRRKKRSGDLDHLLLEERQVADRMTLAMVLLPGSPVSLSSNLCFRLWQSQLIRDGFYSKPWSFEPCQTNPASSF